MPARVLPATILSQQRTTKKSPAKRTTKRIAAPKLSKNKTASFTDTHIEDYVDEFSDHKTLDDVDTIETDSTSIQSTAAVNENYSTVHNSQHSSNSEVKEIQSDKVNEGDTDNNQHNDTKHDSDNEDTNQSIFNILFGPTTTNITTTAISPNKHTSATKRRKLNIASDTDTITSFHTDSQMDIITVKPKSKFVHSVQSNDDLNESVDLPPEFVALFSSSNNQPTTVKNEPINDQSASQSSQHSQPPDIADDYYDIEQRAMRLDAKKQRQQAARNKIRNKNITPAPVDNDSDSSDNSVVDGGWISKSNNTTPQTHTSQKSHHNQRTNSQRSNGSTSKHAKQPIDSDSDDTVLRMHRNKHTKPRKRNILNSIEEEQSTASEHSDNNNNSILTHFVSVAAKPKLSPMKPDVVVRSKRRKAP